MIIGENWLQTGQDGKNRLDNPADFVRVEIEAALVRKIPVIPVLVSRMPMPSVDQLPPTLAELVYRNSTRVDPGIDFNVHIERLIQGLDSLFRETKSDISKSTNSGHLDESSLDKVQKPSQQLKDVIPEEIPRNKGRSTGVPTIMNVKTFVMILGVIYVVMGVLGFIPALLSPPEPGAPGVGVTAGYGYLLGLFPVNILHTLVHLAVGVWGVFAQKDFDSARTFARGVAILYAVLTIFGLIPGLNTMFGLVPLFGHDVWLHALTAITAGYFGFVATSTAKTFNPFTGIRE